MTDPFNILAAEYRPMVRAYDESTKAPYGQVDCLIEGLNLPDLD